MGSAHPLVPDDVDQRLQYEVEVHSIAGEPTKDLLMAINVTIDPLFQFGRQPRLS